MEGMIINSTIGTQVALPQVASVPSDLSAPVHVTPAQKVREINQSLEQNTARDVQSDNHFEEIRIAAEAFPYPLSDKKFTIYKDTRTGEYITRFTSLRDGSVTYYPAPELLAAFKGLSQGNTSGLVVRTDA